MNRPPPIHCREILKSIEHACQCYRKAEQQTRYAVWEAQAGPPEPDQAPLQSSSRASLTEKTVLSPATV